MRSRTSASVSPRGTPPLLDGADDAAGPVTSASACLTPRLPDQLRDFAKLLGLSKRLKLLQRPVLDLADPLARDVEGPPDLGA